jgi:hypothetical protein
LGRRLLLLYPDGLQNLYFLLELLNGFSRGSQGLLQKGRFSSEPSVQHLETRLQGLQLGCCLLLLCPGLFQNLAKLFFAAADGRVGCCQR